MSRSRDRRINARIKRLASLAASDAKGRFEPELQQLGERWIREARRRANNLNFPNANTFADGVAREVVRLGEELVKKTQQTALEQQENTDELARIRRKCAGVEATALNQQQLRRLMTTKSKVTTEVNKAAHCEFTNLKQAKETLLTVAKPAALAVQHIVITTINKDARRIN